ncbi:MAG TPA: hypothetical protein VHM26_14995 [Chitinophagaceae bacterium]|jgi:hypothetical protein|nr:hypothetical protein [Chitinophagaceae bacterium]
MKYFFASLLPVLFFISCSNKNDTPDPPAPPTVVLATLTTEAATNLTASDARLNGTMVNTGGGTIANRGFCWALNANPTLSDNFKVASGSGLGSYFADITNLTPNTIYHVRAYAANDAGIAYGNDIVFTTRQPIEATTTATLNIFMKEALLKGSIASIYYGTVTKKGFCYSTNPNPTTSNAVVFHADGQLGNFEMPVTGLQMNTTYYVRGFAYITAGQVYYGNEITFKTTGAIGASGGYIFYDKGEVTNGWRYLESAPVDISASGPFTTKWGCSGTLIANAPADLGKGFENTARIVAGCADANCAARLCDNYSVNGLTDWFLGSADEMSILYHTTGSLVTYGANQVYWTSTEFNSLNAVTYNMIFGASSGLGVAKTNNGYVRPIRRF